ncbi:GspH/FimT family pseudopilin [Pseudomonas sediminis]|uniref:Type II secretion system protein H n=1 Tax=Pseudomonas sediminis TaxID=1691904 RepID=A0ABX6SH34_9PSED|nr:GspH/FimT family pseudopilin [Pseudomonas sediminis]QNH00440.1 GspH/FimT family pseudopilin [Pseudomonas sediminis]
MRSRPQNAFTLPETLIALTIAAIVLAFATPALSALLQQDRHTTEINQMHASLNYARGQAIQTRTMVSLCAGDDNCRDSRAWHGRILIFLDANRNGQLDEDEQLLKIVDIHPRHRWNWANFRQKSHMSFRPDGTTHSLNGTFTLCDKGIAIRGVVINITGRTMVNKSPDNDRCRG